MHTDMKHSHWLISYSITVYVYAAIFIDNGSLIDRLEFGSQLIAIKNRNFFICHLSISFKISLFLH